MPPIYCKGGGDLDIEVIVNIENEQAASKLAAQTYVEILKKRLQNVPVEQRLEIYSEILDMLKKGTHQ
jgi:hypothetical protein